MRLIRCDRCGREGQGDNLALDFDCYTHVNIPENGFDLCDPCDTELHSEFLGQTASIEEVTDAGS